MAAYSQKQGLSCLVLQPDNFLEVTEDLIIAQMLLLPLPELRSTQPRAEKKSVDVLEFCFVFGFFECGENIQKQLINN